MELMTIDEAAEFFQVSRVSIYKWIKKGFITPTKLGSRTRFVRKDLENFVERNKTIVAQNTNELA